MFTYSENWGPSVVTVSTVHELSGIVEYRFLHWLLIQTSTGESFFPPVTRAVWGVQLYQTNSNHHQLDNRVCRTVKDAYLYIIWVWEIRSPSGISPNVSWLAYIISCIVRLALSNLPLHCGFRGRGRLILTWNDFINDLKNIKNHYHCPKLSNWSHSRTQILTQTPHQWTPLRCLFGFHLGR